MIEKSDIIKAWKILREKDSTIPDETLDFMRDVSLRTLEVMNREDGRTLDDILR
jgi:hypothetical protein